MPTAKLRGFLNQHSAVATIVAVVLLVVALAIIVWQNKNTVIFDYEIYYYDLNTQRIFAGKVSELTPFDNGAGLYKYDDGMRGSAVRAVIQTCGDPSKIQSGMSISEIREAGGVITYLERRSPSSIAMEAKLEAGVELSSQDLGFEYTGTIVASPDDLIWYPMESDAGMKMLSSSHLACEPGQVPKICYP